MLMTEGDMRIVIADMNSSELSEEYQCLSLALPIITLALPMNV